eukprot:GILK01013474.1.p1 GENE.GILK01013474.1~~GILK01013474.1.p1  ORF type:complete len:321 (-),score=30.08 GILK01013474.1:265-1227(-)
MFELIVGAFLGFLMSFVALIYFLKFRQSRNTQALLYNANESEILLKSLTTDANARLCHFPKSTVMHLCGYNPSDPSLRSLSNFDIIKTSTECLFARQAKLWGSSDWNPSCSVAQNVSSWLHAFTLFGAIQRGLDGFLVEVVGQEAGQTVERFATIVRMVLQALSDNDPSGYRCMEKDFLGKRGWVFSFDKREYFITTFAACYPSQHSRYAFGVRHSCFILFQPYSSFLWHNVGNDTPYTNWSNPQTVRDKIRVKYRSNGRGYPIPENTDSFPVAHAFVRPLYDSHRTVVRWWDPLGCNDMPSSCSETSSPVRLAEQKKDA